jgi:hypothetical protein
MNSLILISPSKTWGFQAILSGKGCAPAGEEMSAGAHPTE